MNERLLASRFGNETVYVQGERDEVTHDVLSDESCLPACYIIAVTRISAYDVSCHHLTSTITIHSEFAYISLSHDACSLLACAPS